MKKISYIFIFIFFCGMLSTVISYFPLLEEEVAHTKVSFGKKPNTTEGADAGADDESETGHEKALNEYTIDWTDLSGSCYIHVSSIQHYFCLLDDNSTPPPRV